VQEILYNQELILQAIRVRYGLHHSPLHKVRIDSLGSYHSELVLPRLKHTRYTVKTCSDIVEANYKPPRETGHPFSGRG
jgi:hypothetical protein